MNTVAEANALNPGLLVLKGEDISLLLELRAAVDDLLNLEAGGTRAHTYIHTTLISLVHRWSRTVLLGTSAEQYSRPCNDRPFDEDDSCSKTNPPTVD